MTETETPASAPALAPKARRPHRVIVALLLVIGAILTPITIVTLFVKAQVTDTSRYTQTIDPLAKDPAVQAYVATTVTDQLFEQVNVQQYVEDLLPNRAAALAGPLTSAMRTFTYDAVLRIVQSDQFQKIWKEANKLAHDQMVAVLTGDHDGNVVSTDKGKVQVDLSAVGEQVKARLAQTGIAAFSKIPTDRIAGKVTLFESKDLYRARRAVGLLTKLAFILPILVFLSFAGAIYLSMNRRRGFIAAAIAFTLGASLIALGLAFGRGVYLDAAVNAGLPHDAAAAVYDTLVRFLHTSVRAVLTLSIVVVIAAFFSGPSRLATWFRTKVHQLVDWLGRQSDGAGWTALGSISWVRTSKSWLRYVVAGAAFVLLLFWKHPTPSVIFWIAMVVLFLLAVIEFFGREPAPAATPTPAPAVA
jgi:hypothetical protein